MNQSAQEYPLISVITVCLNASELIAHTIQSVLSQTYSNFEYIIIDGGSTDGTVDIIRQYESILAYWHSKPDRGLSHAMNLGLAKSRGKWILQLHADDFLLEDSVLEKMVPHLLVNPGADVVFGETIIMFRRNNPNPLPLRKIYGSVWKWKEFQWNDTIPHPSSFIRREYFDRFGNYSESYKIAMDYELLLRGGEDLRARYISIPISGMRDGGIGADIIPAAREGTRAQQERKALSKKMAFMNFYWLIGRHYFACIAHKILDPIASRINLSGRISGKILERFTK